MMASVSRYSVSSRCGCCSATVAAVRAGVPARLVERWTRECQPQFAGRVRGLRDRRVADMSDPDLAAHLAAGLALLLGVALGAGQVTEQAVAGRAAANDRLRDRVAALERQQAALTAAAAQDARAAAALAAADRAWLERTLAGALAFVEGRGLRVRGSSVDIEVWDAD